MVAIEAYFAMVGCLPLGHAPNGRAHWRVATRSTTKERAAGTGLARIAGRSQIGYFGGGNGGATDLARTSAARLGELSRVAAQRAARERQSAVPLHQSEDRPP